MFLFTHFFVYKQQTAKIISAILAVCCFCRVLLAISLAFKASLSRWEKFINGEFNIFKNIARVIDGRCHTFLFGYAEIIRRNQKLNVSFQLHNCKKPQRHIHVPSRIALSYKPVVKNTSHTIGYIANVQIVRSIVAPFSSFRQLRPQTNGVNNLTNGLQNVI